MDILNKTNIQNKILRAPEFGEETGGGGASSTPSNALFIGGVEVDKFYLGNSDDVKIFLGDVKLYPRDITYKLVAQYSDTTEYKVECNSSTSLTQTEVTSHTTPVSSMTSAVVSDCVNRIDSNAFSGASSLTSITLDDGVRQFGNQAFTHTEALREMTFPSSLTSIEGACFRFSGIRKFNNKIPSGVTYLSSGAFADMYSLSAMTIPSSVTGSSDNLFLRDSGLTQVHFERETAPALGANAFKNCSALIKIYIPDCDCYDSYAAQSQFSGYTNLIYGEDGTKCKNTYNYKLYRKLKNGVTNTTACNSTSALTSGDVRSNYSMSVLSSSTSGLSEVIVGDCISGVSAHAFDGMSQLTSITFSDNVTTIAASACSISSTASDNHLHDIVFGKKLKTIGNYAFYHIGNAYATNRPQFKIPKSVTSIGENAFLQGKINKITFENGGRCDIGYRSFSGCASYSTFSIDTNSIRKLESYGFAGFTGLTSVRLTNFSGFTSSSATGHQFANCPQLKSITIIANGNTKIPSYFVNGNSLTAVTLGGITEISNSYGLNSGNNSASVRTLTMLDTTPPTIGTTSISMFNPTVIYVPSSAVNTYKTATNWSSYSSIIQAAPTE